MPCCYDYEWKLRNGFAEVIVNGKIALYDLENRIILVNGYDYINQVLDKYVVSFDGKYGLVNSEGKMLTDCIYDDIYEYGIRNGYFEVQLNGKFGCIDSEGNTAVPCIYDEIHSYDDEFTIVKKNGKAGVIDKYRETVVSFDYDSVSYYNEVNLFIIEMNGKYGVIDVAGKILVPLEYDKVHIEQNFIMASKKGRFGILDLDGNPIT